MAIPWSNSQITKRKKRMPEWESGITTSFAAMTCCASTMGSNSSWRKGVNMSKAISRKKAALTIQVALALTVVAGFSVLGGCAPQAANLPDSGSEENAPQATGTGSGSEGEVGTSLAEWNPDMDC